MTEEINKSDINKMNKRIFEKIMSMLDQIVAFKRNTPGFEFEK